MKATATPPSPFVDPSEAEALKKYSGPVHFIKNAIHELLGYGTGKMLSELSPGDFNFDPNNPPTNPVTGKAIETWYRPGEKWKAVFADLANTVEECRATLVSYYLPSFEGEVLSLFGYGEEEAAQERECCVPYLFRLRRSLSLTLKDTVLYYLYLIIGVLGLEALGSYSVETESWGDQHHRVSIAWGLGCRIKLC